MFRSKSLYSKYVVEPLAEHELLIGMNTVDKHERVFLCQSVFNEGCEFFFVEVR